MKSFLVKLSLIRKFLPYLKKYVAKEFLLLAIMIISSIGSLATPYVLKIIIDDIFPKGKYQDLVVILFFLVIVYIIRILCSMGTDVLYTKISQEIISDIRADMLRDILSRPLSFYKEIKSGDILFTFMNDVYNIQSALSSFILNFLSDILTVAGIVVMLGILNLKLTLASLTIVPIILFSINRFTPRLQDSFRRIQEIQESLNNFFLEKIKSFRVIRTYNTRYYEEDKLYKLQQASIKENVSNAFMNSVNSNIIIFFVAIGPVIVLIYGGKDVFTGAMSIGSLIAFIQYLNRLYAPTINIMNSYNNFNKAIVSMERVGIYISETNTCREKPAGRKMILNTLSFKDVSIHINDRQILRNINFRFEKGRLYGIIGPSGSGKSTIVNLLCNFLKPTSGSIVLNEETSIDSIKNWNDAIGLIEKENQLFNDNLLENIKYGSFDADLNSIRKAINYAEFGEVVDSLSEGLSTVINETGTMLSDGQKQRISIARALLKNPQLIIFDEATAALDVELEMKIIKNVRAVCKDAIVVIITHRLSSLHQFDYIYSIADNSVIKEGKPALFKEEVFG